MGSLPDLPHSRLLFELMSEEMNTTYNIHAGTRINQYVWNLHDMRRLSGLSRRKFKLAVDLLIGKSYLLEKIKTKHTPTGSTRTVAYCLNEELQDEIMQEWSALLHEYHQGAPRA